MSVKILKVVDAKHKPGDKVAFKDLENGNVFTVGGRKYFKINKNTARQKFGDMDKLGITNPNMKFPFVAEL